MSPPMHSNYARHNYAGFLDFLYQYFFLLHAKNCQDFFYLSVEFLYKISEICPMRKKNWHRIFFFLTSNEAKKKPSSGFVNHRIYWVLPKYSYYFNTNLWSNCGDKFTTIVFWSSQGTMHARYWHAKTTATHQDHEIRFPSGVSHNGDIPVAENVLKDWKREYHKQKVPYFYAAVKCCIFREKNMFYRMPWVFHLYATICAK